MADTIPIRIEASYCGIPVAIFLTPKGQAQLHMSSLSILFKKQSYVSISTSVPETTRITGSLSLLIAQMYVSFDNCLTNSITPLFTLFYHCLQNSQTKHLVLNYFISSQKTKKHYSI